MPGSTEKMEELGVGLDARLRRPQRHRLLQGYPAMPQMQLAAPRFGDRSDGERSLDGALVTQRAAVASSIDRIRAQLADPGAYWNRSPEARARFEAEVRPRHERALADMTELLSTPDPAAPPFVTVDPSRRLIVGILPHTQCTPKVEGCGFCTFPHDRGDNAARRDTIEAVRAELGWQSEDRALRGREVSALYFGGGTANLAKPEEIEGLVTELGRHARLAQAEVSLEGVASLFTSWFHAPLKMLARLPVQTRRISMGVQTFDRDAINSMGRSAFGDERTVTKLVARCRSMGIGTSGDFLFNLPGQPQRAMLEDVERAIATGLDQICLYNLVLYEGLGTPWSKDPARVAAMPDNETACANWLAVREALLREGFVQTTLTNFERREVACGERAFRYERLSFSPEQTDALGFGPMSLSLLVDPVARRAVKHQRSKNMRALAFSGDDLYFPMEGDDLRLLMLTRSLAKGTLSRAAYTGLCGSELADDFPASLAVLTARGLVELTATHLSLTPRGMFFSDAVVGTLLAEKDRPRPGAGVHTSDALAAPTRVINYDGMG